MHPENEWNRVQDERNSWLEVAGMGAVRVALLFGSAAVALALIIAPFAENQTRSYTAGYDGYPEGVDTMSTGSIGSDQSGRYVVRRSVLQPSPESVCVIRANGARSGDC